jgi:catechol 2,3-dioxygenase-like lactoylglutathione lyase family enzyme
VIVGLDHVALSCAHVPTASELLEAHGFVCRFSALLPNAPEKQPFQRRWEPEHAIALYSAASGPSIEVTCHRAPADPPRSSSPRAAGFQVILEGPLALDTARDAADDGSRAASAAAALLDVRATPRVWGSIQAPFWHGVSDSPAGVSVRAVMLPTPDLDASRRFWTAGMGLVEARTEQGACLLMLRAPVPAWSLSLLLVSAGCAPPQPMVDDAGFPVLGFLCSRLDDDLARLAALGAHETSAPFLVRPADKLLRIALTRGPAGEILELIEVQRRAGSPGLVSEGGG